LPSASIGANYKSCGSSDGTTSKSLGRGNDGYRLPEGHTDGFDLIEKDGTMHLLMGPSDKLKPFVYHWVQLGGNRDLRRDASASSDEGTPHGLRFFQVEEVPSDEGACKR